MGTYVIGTIEVNLVSIDLYNMVISSRFFVSDADKYLFFDDYETAKKFLDDNKDMILSKTCDDNDPFGVSPSELAVIKLTDEDVKILVSENILGYRVYEIQDDINMYFDAIYDTDTDNNTKYYYTTVCNEFDNGYVITDDSWFVYDEPSYKDTEAMIDSRLFSHFGVKGIVTKYNA